MLRWFDFFPSSVWVMEDGVILSDLPTERVLCAHSVEDTFGVESKTRGQGQESGVIFSFPSSLVWLLIVMKPTKISL